MTRQVKEDGRVVRAQAMRESRRAAVLAVAQQIFAQKGYHATSIDDLIEAAGIARGTFYLYFESKRAIFDELLDGLLATLRSVVRRIEVGPGAAPPVEQMDATVDRVLETLSANRQVARILLREAVGIDADFDRKLNDFYGRIQAMIVSAIATGQEMGLVRACDPVVVAHCVLGAIKEVVQWSFIAESPQSPETTSDGATRVASGVDTRHLGREMIAFTLMGLFKSP
jgi:AcrR family transcriptional regulator